jgi:serine/threonine protein kinase
MAHDPSLLSLLPGTALGRYRIDRLLGAGGIGAVFRAYDATLERTVAIKVLGDDPDTGASERLLKEARSASALNHPNICTVYEVGLESGRPFIAMEYLDGQSLAARLAQGPFNVRDAVRYGTDIADALAHAHARGLVHRDLKAANVIVSHDGRPKLVDFGLASRLAVVSDAAATQTAVTTVGRVVGTPYAMAPEQVRGERADQRTDIWAIGVLLYEMLTGSRPFPDANVAALFAAILRDQPRPLSISGVPVALRAAIETCLAKEPDRRYQRRRRRATCTRGRRGLDDIGTCPHGGVLSAARAPAPARAGT